MKKKKNQFFRIIISIIIFIFFYIYGFNKEKIIASLKSHLNVLESYSTITSYDIDDIPPYSDSMYVYLNNNNPSFKEEDFVTISFEKYSDLDYLKRCGVAYANIGTDIMPTEKRTSISNIKPTGFIVKKYDFIKGKYLYNRCHLIAYMLTGENANEKNLITCTRSMNVDGMLMFEEKVFNYVKETNNHVLYRVTPFFYQDDLVARGVQIEACSVEDKCDAIKFNVFVYNVQENIKIDYKTGDSYLLEGV